MKKILYSLTILLSGLLFIAGVNASSFRANIVGNNTFSKDITLYVQVDKLVDFNGACNGLCGLVGNLVYDTNKIELTSISALENFDLTQGKTIVLYKSTGVKSGINILKMTFKNKSLKNNESTTITFSNITASDGDNDIKTDNATKKIKLVKKGSTNKPSIKDEVKKRDNSYLSKITISNGNLKFDKNILTYDVVVDYEITFLEINAIAEDNKAIVTGAGKHDLKVGKNVIKLTVESEDGSKRDYTLNVSREVKKIATNEDEPKKEKSFSIIPIIITIVFILVAVGIIFIGKNKKD